MSPKPNYLCFTCGGPKDAARVNRDLTCKDCGGEVVMEGIIEMTFINPQHSAIRLQGTGSAGEHLPCVETALTGKPSSLATAIDAVSTCMAEYGYAVAMPEPEDIKPYRPPVQEV